MLWSVDFIPNKIGRGTLLFLQIIHTKVRGGKKKSKEGKKRKKRKIKISKLR